MKYFQQKFNMLLEQPDLPAAPVDPAAEPMAPEAPAAPTPDTVAAADDVDPNPAINYKKEQHAQQTAKIREWLHKIQGFNEFLNGLDDASMQSILNSADCDTLYNDIARSETKKISRIAQDMSALVESLKGYLLSADDE